MPTIRPDRGVIMVGLGAGKELWWAVTVREGALLSGPGATRIIGVICPACRGALASLAG